MTMNSQYSRAHTPRRSGPGGGGDNSELLKAAIGAAVGGAVGAFAYYFLGTNAGLVFRLVVIAVGVLAGLGGRLAADETGSRVGVVCLAVALVGIIGAEYGAYRKLVQETEEAYAQLSVLGDPAALVEQLEEASGEALTEEQREQAIALLRERMGDEPLDMPAFEAPGFGSYLWKDRHNKWIWLISLAASLFFAFRIGAGRLESDRG